MYENLIEKKIDSRSIYDGKLLHVKIDSVLLPNGDKATREWVKHPGASAVIPVLPDGNIILVRQYRYPVESVTLEIPAGKLDVAGEDPLECARRELSEETGYTAAEYEKLISIATTVGFSNEWIHIFAARGLKAGEQHPDDDEFINVEKMSLVDAHSLVMENKIIDAKTIVAIMMLYEKLKLR
ncbi:MAG: NUDIX hydrolase [Schwartzia sp.]|nr:NUDIX hydrolase [Schwartzia sp. (in: firmicutes)]